MEYFELIAKRHSIRGFDGRPVEDEKLTKILEAANSAPSGGNMQAFEIYVVTKVKQRSALSKAACAQGFVLTAPVSLVFCASPRHNAEKYGDRGRSLYSVQDATIACAFAMLATVDLGLSTCWTGAFDPEAVRKVIGAGEDELPVAILPIGYPCVPPEQRERRLLEELVHRI